MTARVVRVLPDEPAVDREFDYLLPAGIAGAARVAVGTIVRVDLRGRRVRGWVTALDVTPPDGVRLAPVRKVTGAGPPPPIVDLAAWAAWRWAGRRAHFLRAASPERIVEVPPDRPRPVVPAVTDDLAREAFAGATEGGGPTVARVPPAADDTPLAVAAASYGRALVLVPSVARARHLALALRRAGIEVALHPDDWPRSAAGALTVGSRSAAWAPIGALDATLVIDEHDESYQEESAPTWHARDVVVERARRDGARCVLTSPSPSLAALAVAGRVVVPSRQEERAGWPIVDVVDRRRDDPAAGAWCSPALARALQSGASVACVLNRTGRARLAVCRQCGTVARSEVTGQAMLIRSGGEAGQELATPDGTDVRPLVCAGCGATAFRRARIGTEGVRDELERMARRPVAEVVAGGPDPAPGVELFAGTEALLHRVGSVDVVAFLDFDQELLAGRYRAAEEAMALLVRAARVLGPRRAGGRLVVQTRLPDHPVLQAALHADPSRMAAAEMGHRVAAGWPPAVALAVVSGAGGATYVDGLRGAGASPGAGGITIAGPVDGRYLVTGPDHDTLLGALDATPRPAGRLRVALDPLRV